MAMKDRLDAALIIVAQQRSGSTLIAGTIDAFRVQRSDAFPMPDLPKMQRRAPGA